MNTTRLPISIGVDICQIARISRLILKKDGAYLDRFVRRVLTASELQRFQRLNPSSEQTPTAKNGDSANTREPPTAHRLVRRQAEWLAGRWAAKEAIMKAYGAPSSLAFRHIDTCPTTNIRSSSPLPSSSPTDSSLQTDGILLNETARSASIVQLVNKLGVDSFGMTALVERDGDPGRKDEVRLSISHDGDYAVAFAVAMREDQRH